MEDGRVCDHVTEGNTQEGRLSRTKHACYRILFRLFTDFPRHFAPAIHPSVFVLTIVTP